MHCGKILLIILLSLEGFSQSETYDYGIYFNQYATDPQVQMQNMKEDEQMNFNLLHRRNSNDFGGVNTSLFNFQYRLGKPNSKSRSEIGLQLFSDQEGALIRRKRMLPYFSQHLKLSSKFYTAGGVGVGFYNFMINSVGTFEGASDYALDVSAFVKIYSEKTSIQFTVNQATNSELVPVSQPIIMGRSINLFAAHKFSVGDHVQLQPSLLARYAKKNSVVLTDFTGGGGIHLVVEKRINVGATYEYNAGFNFTAGLIRVPILSDFIDIDISYFVPSAFSERTNVQMFEIGLLYRKTKK